MATAFVTFLVLFFRFGLWDFDLTVPFAYRQDALYFMVVAKTLGEQPWHHFIPRLGAPFGMEAVDFPINCTLDFAIVRVFMLLWGSPGFAVNLYWLLSVCAAGGFGALFLRFLRISPLASLTFGVLFGIAPFTFFRIVAHLNLVTFIIPGGAYLAVALARGDLLERWDNYRRRPHGFTRFKPLILPAVIALFAGLTYVYWPFFIGLVIGLAALIGVARFRRPAILGLAGALLILIGLTATLNIAPSLKFWRDHGRNPSLSYKNVNDADVYGLRIRQMLTPVRTNGFAFMQRIRDKIVAANFPEDAPDANESVGSALGTLGSIGLFVLLAIALRALVTHRRDASGDTLSILAALTVALVLICHAGGPAGLFNVFVTAEVRCYNRVSPFISLFCLAALAIYFDRVLSRRAGGIQFAASLALIVFGALDQITVRYLKVHRSIEKEFHEDRATFAALEARLPPGTAIFQLPAMPFPLDSGVGALPYYENAKPYLQTRTLRWTWGEIMGRHRDWNAKTASLPLEAMTSRIVFAGFEGVLISRGGYKDGQLEQDLRPIAGEPAYVSTDSRWAFYDLRSYRDKLRTSLSPDEWSLRERQSRFPIALTWAGAFSVLESNKDRRWRWCGSHGRLQLTNDSDIVRTVEIAGQLQQFTPGSFPLEVSSGAEEQRLILGDGVVPFAKTVSIPPRSTRELSFRFEGPVIKPPADPRELAFQLTGFTAREAGMIVDSQ
ncbi:MAG TPA: hypothetical protein VM940_13850 [Chthoniobacterales bacterium]|jgi:phosphoglycerol transferase|nr:hypothetical protein [Chthoniobacterales bacterium]